MSEPQPILDYASPRKRGGVRLPANSVLTVTHGPDGSQRIVEQLAGQVLPTLFAAAFGVFVAWIAGSATVRETAWILRHRHTVFDFIMPGIMGLSAAAELVLAVLIIRNTWRRTTLTVNAERVVLEFTAPFTRATRREWATAEVGDIILLPTQDQADATKLAELQLRAPGAIVHLFTDHREAELEAIARKLNRAMSGAPPEVEAIAPQPVLPPVVAPPDSQTLERLRERREGLRERLH